VIKLVLIVKHTQSLRTVDFRCGFHNDLVSCHSIHLLRLLSIGDYIERIVLTRENRKHERNNLFS